MNVGNALLNILTKLTNTQIERISITSKNLVQFYKNSCPIFYRFWEKQCVYQL